MPPAAPTSLPEPSARRLALACMVLVLVAFAAYHNTFALPFVFDDRAAIVENPSVRRLWPLSEVFSPPANGSGAAGRPLLNLSFALNHAISGDAVWSYHALNLLIHAAAGLTLFGLARRTLAGPRLPADLRAASFPLAFSLAALWLVHPLQTESVTFVVQRTESLMGLFYLLTLYAFVRAPDSRGWLGLSVAACLLGMATKEVMVTAPVLVLLLDRTFVAGTFQAAWRQRGRYYLALAATWLLLAALLLRTGGVRGGGAGFGLGVSSWDYLLTQCEALVIYLKLSLWPHPLVVDYGTTIVRDWQAVWPQGLFVLALGALTLWACRRRPAVGFLGAAFFIILSPSSSVVPLVGQTISEHRMYLPLAAVLAAVVLLAHRYLRRAAWWLLGACGVLACAVTLQRNTDYRTELALWADTVAKRPQNARAHYNLGNELGKLPGREAEVIAHYETALRLLPATPEYHFNLANTLARLPGRLDDAIAHYEAVLRVAPNFPEARYCLALLLAKLPGREPEALAHFEAVLHFAPDQAEVHNNLGALLTRLPGRRADAIAHLETALRLQPALAEAHNNLALELAKQPDNLADAISHYEEALRLRPGFAEAHCNLGTALTALPGRLPDAIRHYQEAVRLEPGYLLARKNLALALANTDQFAAAAMQLEAVVALDPADADAQHRLRALRALLRR